MCQYYSNWLLQSIVVLLFIANPLNIGADLEAMAEASRLLAPLAHFAVLFFVVVPWKDFLRELVLPQLTVDRQFWLTEVAILGTTVSPYTFYLAGVAGGRGYPGRSRARTAARGP